MGKNNIILVPTDFTEVADFAIDHAIGIAKILDYKINILHVVNKETKAVLKKEKQTEQSIYNRMECICHEITINKKITAEPILREGSIFTTIAEVAEEIGANIIVMGTHGKLGVQHIIGSYALKVITSASIPFIIVQKRGFGNGYRNIVFPLDSSVESKQKARWAASIAQTFNAHVHIFSFNNSDEFIRRKLMGNLQQVEVFFQNNNIPFTVKFADEKGENFAKQVISFSENINADLIVIMTNNDQFLPGSIFNINPEDERVIFNSGKIPVMCINPINYDVSNFRPY